MLSLCKYRHVKPLVLRCVLDIKLSRSIGSSHCFLIAYKQAICQTGSGCGGSSGKKHSVTYKPYVAPCYKDHDHKNMGLKRPMSPHLTVYSPTLPAMTSIAQRITGSILTFYALMLSGGVLFLSNGIDSYVSMIQSLDLSWPFLFLIKIILGAPFAYHYFCGIRFCAWNAGKWLNMKTVYTTAHKSFILTAVLSVFFALF